MVGTSGAVLTRNGPGCSVAADSLVWPVKQRCVPVTFGHATFWGDAQCPPQLVLGNSLTMDLTHKQMTFLGDLRRGACRARATQDASMIGPLIRANLVYWEDDPGTTAGRREPPASSFTLTALGEASLEEHEARQPVAI